MGYAFDRILACGPGPPAPITLGKNCVPFTVTIPAGAPRCCILRAQATVILADGMKFTDKGIAQ